MEYSNIGKKLRDMRKECGYTQKEVASRLGMAEGTLLAYEKGVRSPNMKKLNELLVFYETPNPLGAGMARAEGKDAAAEASLPVAVEEMMHTAARTGNFELAHKGRKYLTVIENATSKLTIITVSLIDGRFCKHRVTSLKGKTPRQVLSILHELKMQVLAALKSHVGQAAEGMVVRVVKSGDYAELRFPASDAESIRVPPQKVPSLAEHYQKLGYVIQFSGFGGIDGSVYENSE